MRRLTFGDPEYEIEFPIELFSHQKRSLCCCLALEAGTYDASLATRVGILGDPVGAGKTYVALAMSLIPYPVDAIDIEVVHSRMTRRIPVIPLQTTLIIVPHYLFHQWETACGMAEIGFRSFRTSVKFKKYKAQDWMDLDQEDVVLITNTVSKAFVGFLNEHNLKVARVIVDEAHSIHRCDLPRSGFLWLISASYNNINGSRFDVVGLHNEQSAITVVHEEGHIEFVLQEPVFHTVWCVMDKAQEVLSDVFEAMRTALCAGDMGAAMSHFPGIKVDSQSSLLKKVSHHLQDQLIKTNDLAQQARLKQQIEDLRDRLTKNAFCVICYDQVQTAEQTVTPCCHTTYCLSCFTPWIQQRGQCPCCKQRVRLDQLIVVTTTERLGQKPRPVGDKREMFINGIRDGTIGTPCLVFSDYSGTFNVIRGALGGEMRCEELKGTGTQISQKVDAFRLNTIPILFINSRHMGSGLNLEFCNSVVLFHKLQNEMQVIGRCQRPGRQGPLHVTRLWYENE